jgi:hypothetical protein
MRPMRVRLHETAMLVLVVLLLIVCSEARSF